VASPAEQRDRLSAKNKYNLATIGQYLVVQWIRLFGVLLLSLAAVDLYDSFGVVVFPVSVLAVLLFTVSYSVLVERAATRFGPLRPQLCSIYDPYYWWHERLWKLEATLPLLNGTPFKNLAWRLLGVRLGRRVFDDGCYIPEKTLVTIGAGATIGVNSFIHYGVTMGDGSVLDTDAFLMKGEQIAPHTRWQGNPASEVRPVAPTAVSVTRPATSLVP
jgi:non-ribosomal peptide synthetase-like protein